MHVRRPRAILAAAAIAAAGLAACSTTSAHSSVASDAVPPTGDAPSAVSTEPLSEPSSDSASPTTAAPTTVAPVTIVAPATTATPTTTAAPVPAPATTSPTLSSLVLRGTGIGGFEFGRAPADVVGGLGARLSPLSDTSTAYPSGDGYGRFTTTDGGRAFSQPFGRMVCWADGAGDQLCASFGGFADGELSFVGWTYGGHTLLADGGFTGGSRWSDFPAIFSPGTAGCYTYTMSSVGGINLGLLSSGAPFGMYDGSGTFVGPDPAAADVSILSMDAGQTPGDAEGDC